MAKKRSEPNPDLLARLWNNLVLSWRLMFDRRVGASAKMIPLLTVLYMISPVDFMPDLLLPFGVVDDVGVFLLGLQMFIHSAPPGVVDEYRSGKIKRKAAPGTFEDEDAPFQIIDGTYSVRDDEYGEYDEYDDPDQGAY